MPELNYFRKDFPVTPPELRELHRLRLQTLDEVAREASLSGWVPASDRIGWTCHLQPLRRDRRGNLLARIIVRAPHLASPYVRLVRLVKAEPLPVSLG